MDAGQLGDDAWTSLRTLWREERWLPSGLVVAAVAYALWLGGSGVAVSYLVGTSGDGGALASWLSTTTAGTVVGAVLWILGPAAVATVLVVDRVKNVNGNIRHGYRLRHPLLLLLGPGVVLALGYGLLVRTGAAIWPVLAVGVAGGIWLAVRTLAYTYRVFSLSYPILGQVIAFATATGLATAGLVAGGLAAGREPAVRALLAGIGDLTGITAIATAHAASVTVDGIAVPLLAFAAVATPVALSGAYVGTQVSWSLLVRLYRPNVKRPELRTGQRYPPFARPTTRPLSTVVQDAAGVPTSYRMGSLLSRVWPEDLRDSASSASDDASVAPGNDGAAGRSSGQTANGGSRSVYRGGRSQQPRPGGSPADATGSSEGASGSTGGSTRRSGSASDGSASTSSSGGSDAADDTEGASSDPDDSGENVSHTRVFTPPEDADFSATVRCPGCGDAVDASADACPACGAGIDGA